MCPVGGRQRVADDLLADHRAAAVRGDQRRAFNGIVLGQNAD
jgi:hypothetical protein